MLSSKLNGRTAELVTVSVSSGDQDKVPRTRGFTALELEVQDQGAVRVGPGETSPAGSQRVPSRCLPTRPLLCMHPERVPWCFFLQGSTTPTTPFNLNYHPKGFISKYSHTGCWGFNRRILENTVQSITEAAAPFYSN